jgi:hypothetical protein
MIRVKVTVVGDRERPTVVWPDGWPPPREGETVELPDVTLTVRRVVWYPVDDPEDLDEPFVYVVLGPPRPR